MVSTPSPLTPQQERILAFIRDCIRDTGLPPTRDEIAKRFGFSVRASAGEHLQALARKGHLALTPGAWRGIKLTQPLEDPFAVRSTSAGLKKLYAAATLPLVGRVAAGEPLLSADNVDTRIKIEPGLFHPRADFLFRVQGQSMKDAGILDGDLVGVKQQDSADNGQIVVARVAHRRTGEEELTLKRWFRRRNRVTLQPENDAFAPIEIDLAAQDEDSQERPPVTIEGLYVGLIRGVRA